MGRGKVWLANDCLQHVSAEENVCGLGLRIIVLGTAERFVNRGHHETNIVIRSTIAGEHEQIPTQAMQNLRFFV